MAILKIKAVNKPISSSLRTGINNFVWSFEGIYYYNELSSYGSNFQNGIQLSINDFTTDTYPTYLPNKNKSFHSVKIFNQFNCSLVNTTNGQTLPDEVILTTSDLVAGRTELRHHLPIGEPGFAYLGYFDVLFSDDGVNYTEDTLQRFNIYHSLEALHTGVFTLDFNNISMLEIPESGTNIIITDEMLSSALSYSVDGVSISSEDEDIKSYFDYIGDGNLPMKIHISNITGKNCIRYFEQPIEIGQKIPLLGFKSNKVVFDFSLADFNNLPIYEVYFGETITGAFRKNKI